MCHHASLNIYILPDEDRVVAVASLASELLGIGAPVLVVVLLTMVALVMRTAGVPPVSPPSPVVPGC